MKKYTTPEVYIVNSNESVLGPSNLDDVILISEFGADDTQLGNVSLWDDDEEEDTNPWEQVKGYNPWGNDEI